MRVAVFALVVGAFVAFGDVTGHENVPHTEENDQNAQSKFPFWMKVKLEKSQDIFASLAQGDFPSIIEDAESLKSLNSLEGFVRRKSRGYRAQLRTFEFAVDEIQKQAKQENIEGVALGFQQLTLSCVNCHKQFREPRLHGEIQSDPAEPAEDAKQ
ncbi:hypothetical protein OAS39_08040 [Pirellulales bacterium]|nr:hypothetical protein [Pirellulales bacterium]